MLVKTKNYVILGTDTNIGKTYVACNLMQHFKKLGFKIRGLKPIASGCIYNEESEKFENEDVLALQHAAYPTVTYETVNWRSIIPPIAPHIAAQQDENTMTLADLAAWFCLKKQHPEVDIQFIEGVGGVLVPLNDKELWLDWIQMEKLPCILVVGMRLGCINHALLTYNACAQRNIPIMGWIANQLYSDMLAYEENKQTIMNFLPLPLLAELPFNAKKFKFFHDDFISHF